MNDAVSIELHRAIVRGLDVACADLRATNAALAARVQALEAALDKAADELAAARQSRARLVGLVRHLRAWFSATAPDSAFVRRITDERDQYITQATQLKQVVSDAQLAASALHEVIDDLTAERDAARRWAAAWKRAALWERGIATGGRGMWVVREHLLRHDSQMGRARRATEAAEAQERR